MSLHSRNTVECSTSSSTLIATNATHIGHQLVSDEANWPPGSVYNGSLRPP